MLQGLEGAVLMQSNLLITYFSQALSQRNQLKSTYEHKLIVIVKAVKSGSIS